LKPRYFDEPDKEKKDRYKQQIDDAIHELTNGKEAFDYHIYFSEVFHTGGGFDLVIENPPYVRQEGLEGKENYKRLFNTFHGTADLYTCFVENAFNILRPSGFLTVIVSNRFTHTNYGEQLRGFLGKRNLKEILNFNGAEVFESANVDTLVLLAQSSPPFGAELRICEITRKLRACPKLAEYIDQNTHRVGRSHFRQGPWSFASEPILKLKGKISSKGKPLGRIPGLRINRGITTGLNDVFVVDANQAREFIEADPRCKEILQPILKGADIKRWLVRPARHYLIFARTGIQITKYPPIYSYLLRHKPDLEQVWEAKKGVKKWYELRGCNYYNDFQREKVMWTRLSNVNAFSLSKDGEFCLDSAGFFISADNKFHCAILNSRLMLFYFKLNCVIWGKEGIKWFGNSLDSLPIVDHVEGGNQLRQDIHSRVDKIVAAKQRNPDSNTSVLEREIDERVYALYDLTPDEIDIIQAQTQSQVVDSA